MLTALMVLPLDRTDLPRPPSHRAGESRAPSTIACVKANRHASTPSLGGSTALDPRGEGLAGLAHRLDHRAARHRSPVASTVASPTLDQALRAEARRPPNHGFGHSRSGQHHDSRESAMGSAADPRRIGQAGNHRLGADRFSTAPAAAAPVVADLADVSEPTMSTRWCRWISSRSRPSRAGCCSF